MITDLRALLGSDLKSLEQSLQDKVEDLTEGDAQDVVSMFSDLHFPGLVTLLTLGTKDFKRKAESKPFPLTEQNITDTLSRLPMRNNINAEDATRAAKLLMTGEFFRDLASGFATISHTVPALPLDIAQDLRFIPHFPRRLLLAIEHDLQRTPSAVSDVVKDLREDGKINSQHKILVNTMGVIFRQATPRRAASTIHTLLGNQSIRLAIIVFARSKGIEISQEDLDQARMAIHPEEPNLGALLGPGYKYLSKRFGKDRAMKILEEFVS